MTTKQISVSNFKAHCAEELRNVENESIMIELTRHGKVVAIVQAPQTRSSPVKAGTLAGSMTFSEDYDPHESAWTEEEWEMNQ